MPAHTSRAASSDFQFVRYQRQCTCLRNHHLGVATVAGDASHDGIFAVDRFTTAAGLARSVFAAEESDFRNTLANLPVRDAKSNLLDAANGLVAGNAWIYQTRPLSALPQSPRRPSDTHRRP